MWFSITVPKTNPDQKTELKNTMRRLAYKAEDRLRSSKIAPRSEMASPILATETITLLEGRRQKRCCCGRFRIYGSDGVWSWGVAFANFLVNFIIVGLGRMAAIFYVDFINFFHIDRKTASIPFSVQQAGRNLFGPVAGILGQKYGIRSVTILGGIIGSLSAALEYFKMDITSVTFLWGLLFGLSTALTTTINQVSIDQYFEKHRASAGGFAFSGGCLGAIFFPIVIETLIFNYGMQGTFLVMGAIILHVIPAAMILVEPPWTKDDFSASCVANIKQYGAFDEGKKIHSVIISQEPIKKPSGNVISSVDFKLLQDNSDMVYQFLTINITDGSVRSKINQNDAHIFDKKQIVNKLNDMYSVLADREKLDQNNPSLSALIQKAMSNISTYKPEYENLDGASSSSGEYANNDMQCRIFIEHKLQELSGMKGTRLVSHFPYPEQHRAWRILLELRKLSEELSEVAADQTLFDKIYYPVPTEYVIYDDQTKNSRKFSDSIDSTQNPNTFSSHIKTAIQLHKNPLFLLICLCRGVFMLTFVPFAMIAVDFAMDHGLKKSDGKYVIAILSLGDFIGRIGLGWITDRRYLSLSKYMVVGMIALSISTATMPFMHCKSSVLTSILIFAILQGSLFVRHPMLVSNYVKSHEKSIGMGFINFLSGFLGFALPSYIGCFRDSMGSYDCMFYVNGALCAVIGLLWLLEPCLSFCCINKK